MTEGIPCKYQRMMVFNGFPSGANGFRNHPQCNVNPGLVNPWLINRGCPLLVGNHFWREHPPNNGTGSLFLGQPYFQVRKRGRLGMRPLEALKLPLHYLICNAGIMSPTEWLPSKQRGPPVCEKSACSVKTGGGGGLLSDGRLVFF